MTERVIIAGAGGQGIMLLGKVLAEAAMREERHVTWLPSYGAEVRGGTAHCMVIISDAEIGSPYIGKADTVVAMNGPSLKRFKERVRDRGLLIANSSLAGDFKDIGRQIRLIKQPFTDLAVKLGNIKVANMIALGSLISSENIVDSKSVLESIEAIAPQDKKSLIEINRKALSEGMNLK